MKGTVNIGWAIVYIRGREGFQEDVLPKLRDSYLSGNAESDNLMMIWIPDVKKLRSLKLAVGSKTILKYRLQFYTSLSPYAGKSKHPATNSSAIEVRMENPMVVW